MTLIDSGIILAFILYAIVSGLRSRKIASENLDEYFLAGRSLSGWSAGISMAATQFASDTPLLVTGLIATAGLFSLWRLWIYALSFLLMGFVLAAGWRRANVLTDAEFTELRYGGSAASFLRGFKAVYFGLIFNCTVLAMVLFAAARIAEPFLFWNQWLPSFVFEPVLALVRWVGVPLTAVRNVPSMWIVSTNNLISVFLIAFVTLFYSTTGGLRSVVQTDMVQFALAMGGTALYAGFVLYRLNSLGGLQASLSYYFDQGGPAGMTISQILAFTPSQAKDASFVVLAVFALQWIVQINADGTGYLAQRTMACRSDKDATGAAVIFSFAQVLFRSLLWIPIGLGLLVLLPPDLSMTGSILQAERETSFVRGIRLFLPPGAKGVMLTALLAALASTVDTHFNWGASYLTNDLYKRWIAPTLLKRKPSGRDLVWVARLSNVVIFVLALFIMTRLSSIQTAWKTSLLLGSGVGVMLVLRWLWWRITAKGELAALLVSFVLAPVLLWTLPDEQEALRLLLMAVGATAAGILVSIYGKKESKTTVLKFYSRVKPPGFWGPQANAYREPEMEPVRRLMRGLSAMLLTSLSLFCLLTGTGSWLAGSPPPVWMESRILWIGGNLLVGLGLIPVWWTMGFKSTGSLSPKTASLRDSSGSI